MRGAVHLPGNRCIAKKAMPPRAWTLRTRFSDSGLATEVASILGRGDAEPLVEREAHTVDRTKATVVSDGFQWAVAGFQHPPRSIDTRTLYELVWGDPGFLHEVTCQVACAHPDFVGERLQAVSFANVGHHMGLDAGHR